MFSPRLLRIFRTVIIGLVLENFALALAMEVSEELHRKIHQDADCDDHDCIVTMLLAGKCDSAAPPPLLGAVHEVLVAEIIPVLHPQWVAPLFLNNFVLEHAPPALG